MGLTGTCGENLEAARPFQVALSAGGLQTSLLFGSLTQRLDEVSTTAAFTYRFSRWAVQGTLGMVITGSLDGQLGNYRLDPGFLASASISYTILDGTGALPFLAASIAAGFATAPTYNEADSSDRPVFTALDIRLNVVIGKRLFDFWLPYGGIAIIGGPIFFAPHGQSLTGQAQYHVRFSVGSSFTLPAHLEAFVEVGFLAEQNVVVGLGYSF